MSEARFYVLGLGATQIAGGGEHRVDVQTASEFILDRIFIPRDYGHPFMIKRISIGADPHSPDGQTSITDVGTGEIPALVYGEDLAADLKLEPVHVKTGEYFSITVRNTRPSAWMFTGAVIGKILEPPTASLPEDNAG